MTASNLFKHGVRFNFEPKYIHEVWWNGNFFTVGQPSDLCDFLTKGLPRGRREYIVDKIIHKENRASVEAHGYSLHKTKIFWTGRTILFSERELNLDLSSIEPPFQGAGYGTSLARNCYLLAVNLNLDRLTVTAIGSGSYVWARAGFIPSEDYWLTLRREVRAFLPKISGISVEDHQFVDSLLSSNDPVAIWALSDFDAEVNVETKNSTERCTLGKALLFYSDTSWKGSIELLGPNKDADQLKRVSAYLFRRDRSISRPLG